MIFTLSFSTSNMLSPNVINYYFFQMLVDL